MSRPIYSDVVCACGWRGSLTTKAPCAGCGADHRQRVTTPRLAVLGAIIEGKQPRVEPNMRRWFISKGLLRVEVKKDRTQCTRTLIPTANARHLVEVARGRSHSASPCGVA